MARYEITFEMESGLTANAVEQMVEQQFAVDGVEVRQLESSLTADGEPRYVTVENMKTGKRRGARVGDDGVVRDESGTFDANVYDILATDADSRTGR